LTINFQELYESYASEVYRFSLWLSGDSLEAEDITSETFVRVWVHNRKIRTETLKAYLFTISRNIYLGHQRKKNRQVVLEDVHPDPSPGPEKRTEAQLKLKRVRKALQAFPEIDRAAFVLRVQHELPYDEIARILELSLTATKVKVYRVRKKLIANCIDKEDF
jgi:RNA polymerase sigma-70 factor (ECF subfamily)